MLIVFTFMHDFTVGPVTYSMISELSSTRLKAKTIGWRVQLTTPATSSSMS